MGFTGKAHINLVMDFLGMITILKFSGLFEIFRGIFPDLRFAVLEMPNIIMINIWHETCCIYDSQEIFFFFCLTFKKEGIYW